MHRGHCRRTPGSALTLTFHLKSIHRKSIYIPCPNPSPHSAHRRWTTTFQCPRCRPSCCPCCSGPLATRRACSWRSRRRRHCRLGWHLQRRPSPFRWRSGCETKPNIHLTLPLTLTLSLRLAPRLDKVTALARVVCQTAAPTVLSASCQPCMFTGLMRFGGGNDDVWLASNEAFLPCTPDTDVSLTQNGP